MNTFHVLVCVTGQRTCERLIRAGAELAGDAGEVNVLHVARIGQPFLGGEDEAAALDYLFQVSTAFGADMTLIHSGDAPSAIAAFARERGAEILLLGTPRGNSGSAAFAAELRRLLPEMDIREMITSGD